MVFILKCCRRVQKTRGERDQSATALLPDLSKAFERVGLQVAWALNSFFLKNFACVPQ